MEYGGARDDGFAMDLLEFCAHLFVEMECYFLQCRDVKSVTEKCFWWCCDEADYFAGAGVEGTWSDVALTYPGRDVLKVLMGVCWEECAVEE